MLQFSDSKLWVVVENKCVKHSYTRLRHQYSVSSTSEPTQCRNDCLPWPVIDELINCSKYMLNRKGLREHEQGLAVAVVVMATGLKWVMEEGVVWSAIHLYRLVITIYI